MFFGHTTPYFLSYCLIGTRHLQDIVDVIKNETKTKKTRMAVCEQVKNNLAEFLRSEGTLANVKSKGLIKVPALLMKQNVPIRVICDLVASSLINIELDSLIVGLYIFRKIFWIAF